uniref:Golgin subfamily B member 1-like n=1 Tax=Denticeps clupeoides TaxID=299321 RepID=A0AAY4DYI0_9TELE
MLKWFSGEEAGAPGSPQGSADGGGPAVSEMTERLAQTEQLVAQLKELIREKDAELRSRDEQLKELMERMRRLQSERENLQSKLEAEKHVMRAQLLDLMQKHEVELLRVAEKHEHEMSEKEQAFRAQLEESKRTAAPPFSSAPAAGDTPSLQRLSELEGQVKLKAEEASKSETKFLKMKAWSKSRIRQLEDELKKAQSGSAAPDVTSLRSRITELEEQRQEILCKLETYDELKARNDLLEKKLVVYEEQQRKMQADLEQVTKRAASQASESGSVEEFQSQVLEWQDMVSMVTEAEAARDQAREEKNAMALRMSHIEEEREGEKRKRVPDLLGSSEDFEFDGHRSFPDPSSPSGSTTPMEGENMGGWWPEYSTPDTEGLRSVVEELELERNQLQEQILALEERCQDLEDRRQLQSRIEALQNESERLQAQVSSLRSQQMREAEKHQLLVSSLNEQLKGLSDTQECLESSLMEKEHTLAKTSEKLELIDSLQDSLKQKEEQYKDVADKLIQTEHNLSEMTKKFNTFEKQCTDLKVTVTELTHKLSLLKEKTQKQEATNESLQTELDQTNEELDKLNTAHLEERAELIHDLQSCEREIDNLKDILIDKDKEINGLSGNMAEYADQIHGLKQEIKQKDEDLLRTENALRKAEREAQIIRETQSSDQQSLNAKVAELLEEMKDTESELKIAREQKDLKMLEAEDLTKQVRADRQTIQDLRTEIQKLNKLKDQLHDKAQIYEKELKSYKDEQNKLLAEVSKHKGELQSLSKQLEEQVQSQEQVERMVEEKLGLITSLEQKLKDTQKESEGERLKLSADLKAKDIEMDKMNKELADKSEGYLKLETQLDSLRADNQEVQAAFEKRREEFMAQKKLAEELSEKVRDVLEQNSSMQLEVNKLMVENGNLQQEIAEKFKSFSELMLERDFLLSKMGVLEAEHSEKGKIVDDRLLEKTNECNHLSKLLHESKMHCTSLQDQVKNTHSQVDHLNSGLEEKDKCIFVGLQQIVGELDNKAAGLLEQNSQLSSQICSLTEQNEKLGQERDEKCKQISDTEQENVALERKLSGLELQHSENRKIIEGLMKDKEQLFKNKETISENLLEKTNECSRLTSLLRDLEENSVFLKEQADSANTRANNLESTLAEKEEEIAEKNAQKESQQSQINQHQETLNLLQEQGRALKSGLMEKDLLLQQKAEEHSSLLAEIQQQKDTFSKLQNDMDTLKSECSSLSQNLEEKDMIISSKNQECQSHMDELTKRNESVFSLSGQLADINENLAKLDEENVMLKGSVENYSSENARLREEMTKVQSDFVDLQDSNQALKEQTHKLKAEIQKFATDASVKLEEMTFLKNELSDRDKFLNTLREQMAATNTAKQDLQLTLQQKDDSLKQQEMFIKQLQAKSVEGEGQMSQQMETITELQKEAQSLQAALQSKDMLLLEKERNLTCLKETLVSESDKSQSQVSSSNEIISKLQQELKVALETSNHLTEKISQLDLELKQKADECLTIKEHISSLEDSHSQIQTQMQNLTSECDHLKKTLTKKEQDILNMKSTSLACTTSLNEQLKAKESECDSLKEQLSGLNDTISKLNISLRAQSSEISSLQEAFKDSTDALLEQTKAESVALLGKTDCSEHLAQPQRDLQSCVQEIHQREALLEQLNARLQQAVDEKNGVSSQLKAVSQTLRESQLNLNELQNRCYWLERQVQIQQAPTQRGSVSAEVAPGAPQEKSSSVVDIETTETQELRNRLSIAECQLASSQQIVSQLNDRLEDERARRLAAEEALGFTEERVKSMDATSSRSSLRDFSIQLETEDEWEALILDPNQHVLMRKVKGGVLSCKRWLRGRSLYCSKLLTTRAKSRYLFLSYLLILHVLVFMCLSGVL